MQSCADDASQVVEPSQGPDQARTGPELGPALTQDGAISKPDLCPSSALAQSTAHKPKDVVFLVKKSEVFGGLEPLAYTFWTALTSTQGQPTESTGLPLSILVAVCVCLIVACGLGFLTIWWLSLLRNVQNKQLPQRQDAGSRYNLAKQNVNKKIASWHI